MNLELAKAYAPHLYFDEHEPFYPVRVGVTLISESAKSPSFNRFFSMEDERLSYIVEYAIYWDYDIQHLYELEHVWIYVAKDGSVLDCEASFHGKYFKGLLKDRSNLDGNHVLMYSQPGKHAFSPRADLFELIPNLMTCTDTDAGIAGLIVTGPFQDVYSTNDGINRKVCQYLQRFRFKPSMEFRKHVLAEELFVTWEELRREIPLRIREQLRHIKSTLEKEG